MAIDRKAYREAKKSYRATKKANKAEKKWDEKGYDKYVKKEKKKYNKAVIKQEKGYRKTEKKKGLEEGSIIGSLPPFQKPPKAHYWPEPEIKPERGMYKTSPVKMNFSKSFCSKSPLKARGDKTGTSEGSMREDGYNVKATYKENKKGEKVKRKELTRAVSRDAQESNFTGGDQDYTPERKYTTQLKKYNKKGELKKTKTVTSDDKAKKHKKLRKKYYRGNKKVSHKKV